MIEAVRTKSAKEIWEIALGDLQVQVSKPNYRTWFSKTVGLSCDEGICHRRTEHVCGGIPEKNQLFNRKSSAAVSSDIRLSSVNQDTTHQKRLK